MVGGGELAATVVQRMQGRPDVGIQVLGVVGDDKDAGRRARAGSAATRTCARCSTRTRSTTSSSRSPTRTTARLGGLLDAVGDEPVTIHVVPDLFRFASLRGGVEEFEGMPFIHLRDSPLYGWSQVAKRGFDVVFRPRPRALAVLLVIALAVRLTSPGPCSTGRSGWASTASASAC